MAKANLFKDAFLGLTEKDTTVRLASGTINFYKVGGTIPKDAYTNADKGATVANPLTLDANGAAEVYLDGRYRVLIKNSAGGTEYDMPENAWQVDTFPTLSITSQLQIPDGSVTTPGIAGTTDTNSGLYKIAADNWGMAMGGAKISEWSSAGLIAANIAADTLTADTLTAATLVADTLTADILTADILTVDNLVLDGNTISTSTGNITLGNLVEDKTNTGIVAGTTQTQVGATELTATFNEVATVSTDNDGVRLPVGVKGLTVEVYNNGAELLRVWPSTGGDLGRGIDTALIIATGTTITFKAYSAVLWAVINKYTNSPSSVRALVDAGHGSIYTKIRELSYGYVTGNAIIPVGTWTTDGTGYTINEEGTYCIDYIDGHTSASAEIGISLNSTQLTTPIKDISIADQIAVTAAPTAGWAALSQTMHLSEGDIVRPHTDGTPNLPEVLFRITKVG